MTTITIKNGLKLTKTHFENWEDFQLELVLMQEKFILSPNHIKILESREEDADNKNTKFESLENVISNIQRKDV